MWPLVLALAFAVPHTAADWLSASGDPRHTRNQPAETELSPVTVSQLQLLWKYHFDERLTAPIVLGPIFTHRGIKELVFVAGAGDNLYAVDADLGRLFWTRHFEGARSDCTTGLTATPVLAPYDGPVPEGDDASTPRRSLFVLTSDGQLHTVRPADAKDLSTPEPFVPAGSIASELTLTSRVVSTYVSGGCSNQRAGEYRHVIGAREASIALVAKQEPKAAIWHGYRVENKPTLTISRDATTQTLPVLNALPPVAANGVAFTLSGTELLAFEIATGKQLFRSSPNGIAPAQDSLAIANGHVYFVAGTTLYCYGFPIEI